MYAQKLGSGLGFLYGFFQIILILCFAITLVWSIVFWIKRKTNRPYLPFLINLIFLTLTIILPLNWIRNRAEFFVYKNDYEKASKLAYNENRDSTQTLYMLPNELQYLSVGGGQAWVLNNSQGRAVFFFTFRGVPDGIKGFVKISGGSNCDAFTKNIGNEIGEIKDLGDNWYYVSSK